MISMNILYMLTSLLMISFGTIGEILNRHFLLYSVYFDSFAPDLLFIYWISVGVMLLCVSIYGIIGAFKESVIWTNIFGAVLTIVFVLQIAGAIVAFAFIGQSEKIAKYGMNNLMSNYGLCYYDHCMNAEHQVDWIQKNFKCCGNNRPNDWNMWPQFYQKFRQSGPATYYLHNNSTIRTTPAPSAQVSRIPPSCCIEGSNYNNLKCGEYYPTGCLHHLEDMVFEFIIIVGSVALVIAVLEILGIVFAFVTAKRMRESKSFLAVHQCKRASSCEKSPLKTEDGE